jgi:uncharacterized delta-60 repeat protein
MKAAYCPFLSFSMSCLGRVGSGALLAAALWLGGLSPAANAQGAGSVDTTFDPGSGANSNVRTVTVQPDGKLLLIGNFTAVNGISHDGIARLNADGSLDNSFSAVVNTQNVYAVALQPDGKIVLGGFFSAVNNTTRNQIARLNADGSLDASFDAGLGTGGGYFSIVAQSNGKLVVGGIFNMINGANRPSIDRFNADGSVDPGFNPGDGANGAVKSVAVQADGKIVFGGAFTFVNGSERIGITRLNADGSADSSFNPGEGAGPAGSTVEAVAVQPDGKILIGGDFRTVNGVARAYLARLNADGSLDAGFNSGSGTSSQVYSIAVQSDGKIVIGGSFISVDAVARNFIARLNADGSLDSGFDPGSGADATVTSVALQSDGKIVLGGGFTAINGVARVGIARLNGVATNPALSATLLTDLNNRAFAAGSTITLSASADDLSPNGEELARVDFIADGIVFASFDGMGNPLTSAYGPAGGNRPVRRAAGDPVRNKAVFQAPFQLPGVNKLISIIIRALDKLGRSQNSASVTVQSVVTADRPPLVALGSPSGGQRVRVGAQVNVPASVSDPDAASASGADRNRPVRRAFEVSGVVARVEYFINKLKAKDSTEPPFGLSFTPPAAGTYVLTAIATDGSGLANVSKPLVIVAATGVNVSALGDGVAVEGGKKGKVLFSRPGDTTGDLTVLYKTKGTAKNGRDYESLSGSAVIPAGSESVKLKIKPKDNAKAKGTRKITIQLLESPTGDYALGESVKAKLRLLDND